MYTLLADVLWYYFIAQDELYSIDFHKLWDWAHQAPSKVNLKGIGRLYDYPEKPQGKYEQMNRTVGRCVPIADIAKEVGYRLYHVTSPTLEPESIKPTAPFIPGTQADLFSEEIPA